MALLSGARRFNVTRSQPNPANNNSHARRALRDRARLVAPAIAIALAAGVALGAACSRSPEGAPRAPVGAPAYWESAAAPPGSPDSAAKSAPLANAKVDGGLFDGGPDAAPLGADEESAGLGVSDPMLWERPDPSAMAAAVPPAAQVPTRSLVPPASTPDGPADADGDPYPVSEEPRF